MKQAVKLCVLVCLCLPLAAQACGCSIESGALAYLGHETDAGGGLAAAHAPTMDRIRQLLPFAASAKHLVELGRR